MRASIAVIVVAGLVGLVGASSDADAACVEGTLRYPGSATVRHDIPVYLLAPNTDFVGIPTAYVEHEIEMALDEWYENCDCDFRPYYAGLTTSTSTSGRVVVREDNPNNGDECSSSDQACEQTSYQYVNAGHVRVGSRIWIIGHADGSWWSQAEFRRIFTHEIGHAFGLEDTYAPHCGNGVYTDGGIMGNGTLFTAASIGLDDQLGMQALYGGREFALAHRQTTDLANWSSSTQLDSTLTMFDFPLGSSITAAAEERFAFAAAPSPIFMSTIDDDVEITDLPLGTEARNMVSMASKSTNELFVIYSYGESQTDGNRFLKWLLTEDGGATWTDGFIVEPSGWPTITPYHGVTASYDDRTDRYIVAWRRTGGGISLATVAAEAPHPQGAITNTVHITWRTPSIECTPQMYLPTSDTCLLVWLSDFGLHPILRKRIGIDAVSGNVPAAQTPSTSNLVGYSMPALSETRRTDYPWLLAAKQGNQINVWKKTASGSWSSANSFNMAGAKFSPSLSMAYENGIATYHVRYAW